MASGATILPFRTVQPIQARANPFDLFANRRRPLSDVMWLKENAEILSVVSSDHVPDAQATYAAIYGQLAQRFSFFPMYYRFYLGLALDLERMGVGHGQSDLIAQNVTAQNLVHAELSDLQRMEAHVLLARAGYETPDNALVARAHRFLNTSRQFAVPNKKIAYELTHLLFYLSAYGTQDPHVTASATISTYYVGILAHLEGNVDLLSEVCVALTFAKATVPLIWHDMIVTRRKAFSPLNSDAKTDDYHAYLMCEWASSVLGGRPVKFSEITNETLAIVDTYRPINSLLEISTLLLELTNRPKSWEQFEWAYGSRLTPATSNNLSELRAAIPQFEEWFADFVCR